MIVVLCEVVFYCTGSNGTEISVYAVIRNSGVYAVEGVLKSMEIGLDIQKCPLYRKCLPLRGVR